MDKSSNQFKSIDEYINSCPMEIRNRLQKLRGVIQKEAPAARETIKYRMPTFILNGNLIHFAGYKNHIGLYPTPSPIAAFSKELAIYKKSKGAIQFPNDKPLPLQLVRKIVAFRVKQNRTSTDKYFQLFNILSETVRNFIDEVNRHNLREMATDEWTVKDELCHIAGWHEYYAQNYAAMAVGTKPFLYVSKGGSTRNQEMVEKLKNKSKKYLLNLLEKAHSSLYDSIVVKKVPRMTYIVGTDYTTESFLEMIIGHINRHMILVRKVRRI